MKTTGIFEVHDFEIPFNKYGDTLTLIPFGDVHRSSTLCHVDKWHEFLDWAKKKENCYFVGMGDYDDLSSGSERPILTSQNLHSSTIKTLEQTYEHNVNVLCKELEFMRGKIVGLIEGNHYGLFSSGITTTQLMCQKLGCKYLGVSAFINLNIKNHGNTHLLPAWLHHGLSGGRTLGGSINKPEQMMKMSTAQICLMGHDHKKHIALTNRFSLTKSGSYGSKLRNNKILIARTGSFLRGYVPGEASYITDGCYSPTDLGVIKITLTPKRDCTEGDCKYIDIHASL